MKRCQKNLANTIVLMMCMLFCGTIYFEQKNTSSLIALGDEYHSTLECVDADLDLNEEVQIIEILKFSNRVEKQVQHNHFHFEDSAIPLFFIVWQPPKLG